MFINVRYLSAVIISHVKKKLYVLHYIDLLSTLSAFELNCDEKLLEKYVDKILNVLTTTLYYVINYL